MNETTKSGNGVIIGVVVVLLIIIIAVIAMASSSKDDAMMEKEGAMMDQNDNAMVNTTTTTTTEEGVMVGGAMMVANKDIVANAMMASNVTTLVAAVKAAGLVETLQGAGPFTVFAPTNAAFNKLPAGTVETLLKPENKTKLAGILTYHVVAGRYTAADLKDGQVLKTVNGQNITIGKSADGMIKVNGSAMVETADVISSNGVTFVIDSVLMPK